MGIDKKIVKLKDLAVESYIYEMCINILDAGEDNGYGFCYNELLDQESISTLYLRQCAGEYYDFHLNVYPKIDIYADDINSFYVKAVFYKTEMSDVDSFVCEEVGAGSDTLKEAVNAAIHLLVEKVDILKEQVDNKVNEFNNKKL